ncbi:tyrosine-protein phosphatase [Candidatus Woesearchaeota archaeon]|nr:tyrosine-protein phosphatase [Candidatus Woesearchaeota archaeon]
MKKLLLTLPIVFSGCSLFSDNFHKVDSQFYRSGQLEAQDLEAKIKKYGIKTVVNLRGDSDKKWYQGEARVCFENNVVLYDVPLSARRLPTKKEVEQVLDVFEKGPYPMLIHCIAGADRSGLASALYRIHVKGEDANNADDELSLYYGHIAIPIVGTYALDEFLILYKKSGAETIKEFLNMYDK